MKWNWGLGLIVAIIGFMLFILSMVIKMSTDINYNHDLVAEDYYAKEMVYQNEIDAELNTITELDIKSYRLKNGWMVQFPKKWNPSAIKGQVEFYRPSNKKLDFSTPIVLNNTHQMKVNNPKLIEGRWNIRLSFVYNGKAYLKKQSIFF